MRIRGRVIVLTAIAVYVVVAGLVLLPSDATGREAVPALPSAQTVPPAKLEGLPYRGVAMQLQHLHLLDGYERSIDEIVDLGADTVSIVVDVRQENGTSSEIFIDMRWTATPEQLGRIIRYAKSKKLRVLLMPIVLLHKPVGNEWRGTLKPNSWENWFESYRQMIAHYARIAQQNGVDVFVVGSELVSTQSRVEEWTKTIQMIRGIYKGHLTYSANWDNYTKVPFWDQLDLIGMNSYWKLGDDRKVSVDEIVRRWQAIQGDLFKFVNKTGKPMLLLEAGWCSLENAAHEPWDYTRTQLKVDVELQSKLYEGFFRAWHGRPELAGFMMWEWPPGDFGPEDRGYSPEGKPAEKVLREWFAKPWK